MTEPPGRPRTSASAVDVGPDDDLAPVPSSPEPERDRTETGVAAVDTGPLDPTSGPPTAADDRTDAPAVPQADEDAASPARERAVPDDVRDAVGATAPATTDEGHAADHGPGTEGSTARSETDAGPAGGDAEGSPGSAEAPDPGAAVPPTARTARGSHRRDASGERTARRRRLTRVAVVVLAAMVVAAGVAVAHLWRTSDAWERRAGTYQGTAEQLGGELATTRGELEGARSELAAVRDQLATANTRIAELANEKAQIGDDREAQRQLADYQERVTEAAGDVALALDQCVQGQQQLITYLRAQADAPPDQKPYDEAALTQYAADVDTLCEAATEANATLQTELER